MALRIAHWVSRLALAAIFFYSGYIKLQSTLQFAATLSSQRLLPMPVILPVATYLPWVEVALGALLLAGWQIRWVARVAAGLLALFLAVLVVTYLRGIEADCGCFGVGDRISPRTLARDALFLAGAIFLSVPGRKTPGQSSSRVT